MSNDESAHGNGDADQQCEVDDRVGYKHPPKSGQFKPGKSGNPKGRKRKPKSVADQVQTELNRKVTVNEGGIKKKISLQIVMLRTFASKAAKGDIAAAKFLHQLLDAPEHQSKDTIDANAMAAEDRAILDDALSSYLETQNPAESSGGDTDIEIVDDDIAVTPSVAPNSTSEDNSSTSVANVNVKGKQ